MKEVTYLSQILLNQIKQKSGILTLMEKGPVLEFLPPFLLKETLAPPNPLPQFSFQFFTDSASFKKQNPEAQLRRGHPMEIYRFLAGNDEVYLDFEQLGCVCLSREERKYDNANEKMSLWLDYALSPELWGPEGKWTRFHERLHNLFEQNNLLERSSLPGYYPLKSHARSWEKYPFRGDHREGVFALVLPWTFSLTDLKMLESLLNEEH